MEPLVSLSGSICQKCDKDKDIEVVFSLFLPSTFNSNIAKTNAKTIAKTITKTIAKTKTRFLGVSLEKNI